MPILKKLTKPLSAQYDDWNVNIINLLETYDRLIAFGQKNLSTPFVQEGIQSISTRNRILRELCSQNPPISKVFREIGLADEQGSGMGNTYKYTKLYSGGSPEFIEGDVFHTVMPLAPITAEMVGPQDVTHVTLHDTLLERILVF